MIYPMTWIMWETTPFPRTFPWPQSIVEWNLLEKTPFQVLPKNEWEDKHDDKHLEQYAKKTRLPAIMNCHLKKKNVPMMNIGLPRLTMVPPVSSHQKKQDVRLLFQHVFSNPRCEPWCWNIDLQLGHVLGFYVGKSSSTMVRIWECFLPNMVVS